MHHVTRAARDAWLLLAITVALVLLALTVSPNRLRTLRRLGLGALAGGLLAAAGYLIGREVAFSRFSDQDTRAAARAVWNIYLGGLLTWGLVLAGAGLVLAATSSLRRPRASIH